jgi:hypothetical protein
MTRKITALVLFGLLVFNTSAQLRFIPLEQFYRDRTFLEPSNEGSSNTKKAHRVPTFFPVLETEYHNVSSIDTTKNRSTWFGRKLFDEHFFQNVSDEYFVSIDPIVNLSAGRDRRDINQASYFQNTRGIRVTGGIGRYFGFYSTLQENQARFVDYKSAYIKWRGEYYPTSSGNFVRTNGFVPGAARTKDFKTDGFDFAFVTGGIIIQAARDFTISLGNGPMFVGAGYRSLFLSDHSNMAPSLRFSIKLHDKLHAEIIYAQHLNLVRTQLINVGTEAFYQKKGFTAKYITYTPVKQFQISLFEGTSWQRWTDTEALRAHSLIFNPLPLINPAILGLKHQRSNTVLGLNAVYSPLSWLHIYSQIAIDNFKNPTPALQAGIRITEPFGINNLHAILEANIVPETFYQHDNSRLNYIHNNTALAHPMGAGFNEILGRLNYEFRRIGFSLSGNLYQTIYYTQSNFYGTPLLAVAKPPQPNPSGGPPVPPVESVIALGQIDFYYRFNRKNNLQIFASALYRDARARGGFQDQTLFFNFGIRTLLSNQYFDF